MKPGSGWTKPSGADRLVTSVSLFDVYRGKGVPAGKKSVALHLAFSRDDRTLESAEVDAAMARVRAVLEKGFAAEMRA